LHVGSFLHRIPVKKRSGFLRSATRLRGAGFSLGLARTPARQGPCNRFRSRQMLHHGSCRWVQVPAHGRELPRRIGDRRVRTSRNLICKASHKPSSATATDFPPFLRGGRRGPSMVSTISASWPDPGCGAASSGPASRHAWGVCTREPNIGGTSNTSGNQQHGESWLLGN
jgi:hypothetical protein